MLYFPQIWVAHVAIIIRANAFGIHVHVRVKTDGLWQKEKENHTMWCQLLSSLHNGWLFQLEGCQLTKLPG